MIKTLYLLSQNTIVVTRECNFKCGFCALWQQDMDLDLFDKLRSDVTNLIKDDLFFKIFKKKKVFNVVGGDPFCFSDLLFLLDYLKAQGIKIRLWTNGLFEFENLEKALKYLAEVVLYIPSTEQDIFREITGVEGREKLVDVIDFLKANKKRIILNYPIRQDTIQYLPEIYDFSFEQKLPLIIHYDKKEPLSSESRRYINRFKRVANVMTLKAKSNLKPICAAYPQSTYFQEIWQRLSQKFSLYFFLKRKLG